MGWGFPHSGGLNVLDWNILVSKFEFQLAIIFTFGQILLEKV